MDSLIKPISCLTAGAAGALQLCAPMFSPMDLILGCHCVLSYARHLTPETRNLTCEKRNKNGIKVSIRVMDNFHHSTLRVLLF